MRFHLLHWRDQIATTRERVHGRNKMTGLATDPLCKLHHPGVGHPESPARFDAVMRGLEKAGLADQLFDLGSRVATPRELRLCHGSDYLSLAEHEILDGHVELSTGDTHVCENSWAAAGRAVGGVLNAVDALMTGRVDNAFCVTRPPGHHASDHRGMGFCIVNHVAIGARYAQQKHGVERVLIVDWDVHHGNGTQDIFYEDASVFFFSTHQSPWYPGTGARGETGAGTGRGTTLNCPLPAGSGRREIFDAFETQLRPAVKVFQPNLVFISAGFDSHVGDPLGDFRLADGDFHDLTRLVLDLGKSHGAPVVSVLEGGYDLEGLATASAAHVSALIRD